VPLGKNPFAVKINNNNNNKRNNNNNIWMYTRLSNLDGANMC
jgi:hypothetical protein